MARTLAPTSQYYTVADPAANTITALTIAGWIRWDGLQNGNIVCVTDGLGSSVTWSHQIKMISGAKVAGYTFAGGAVQVDGTSVLSADVYYHVAVTMANGAPIKVYVNGVLEATGSNLGSMFTGGTTWKIGDTSGLTNIYSGRIAEFGLWYSVLTAGQIAALAAGTSSPGTIGGTRWYLPFCGTGAETDSSGNGLTVTANGSPTVSDHPSSIENGCGFSTGYHLAWLPTFPGVVSRTLPGLGRALLAPHTAPTVFVGGVETLGWEPIFPDRPDWTGPLDTSKKAKKPPRPDPPHPPHGDPVPVLAWAPRFPDRLPPQGLRAALQQAWAHRIDPSGGLVPALSWLGVFPARLPPISGLGTAQQAAEAAPIAATGGVTPELSWASTFPDRVPAAQADPSTLSTGSAPVAPVAAVVVPEGSWAPVASLPLPQRILTAQQQWFALETFPRPIGLLVPLSWAPRAPVWFPPPSFAAVLSPSAGPQPPTDPIQVETAAPWQPHFPARLDRAQISVPFAPLVAPPPDPNGPAQDVELIRITQIGVRQPLLLGLMVTQGAALGVMAGSSTGIGIEVLP